MRVAAVVLAAGMSRRMGQSKVLLAWAQGETILEHILDQLRLAQVEAITVVTGSQAEQVAALAKSHGAVTVYNADYEHGEMLSSLKIGLRVQPENITAVLVVLGDQPRIQADIVGRVIAAYVEGEGDLVAPSYNMRRGHPILIDRRYWEAILALPDDATPRDVIGKLAITYVNVDNDSILRDVDTPDDYREERRKAGLE